MAFRGNVFQGQVSNPGIGAGTNVIAQGTNILGGMINQRERNKQSMINELLGQGGKLFGDALQAGRNEDLQTQKDTAEMERLKLQLPTQNLTRATSLINAGTTLLNDGNPQGQILVDQGRALMNTGGLGLDTQQDSGLTPTPSMGQSMPNFEPINAQDGGDVGVGDEFVMPQTESFDGFDGTFSAQKAQGEVAKKTQEAQTAKLNFNTIEGLSRASQLPDGIKIKDKNNTTFINLKSNDTVRNLFSEGANLRANKPDEAIKLESAINQDEEVFNLLAKKMDILEKNIEFPSQVNRGGLEQGLRATGNMFFNTPFPDVNKAFVALQNNPKLEKARAAADSIEITINGIAKKLQDGGVVTAEDADQTRGALPGITELSKEAFKAKKEDLANLLLRPMIKTAVKLGNAQRYNQAQKIYKKLTGSFAQIGEAKFSSVQQEGQSTSDAQIEIGGPEQIPFSEMTNADLLGIDETTLPAKDRILLEKELIKRTRQ